MERSDSTSSLRFALSRDARTTETPIATLNEEELITVNERFLVGQKKLLKKDKKGGDDLFREGTLKKGQRGRVIKVGQDEAIIQFENDEGGPRRVPQENFTHLRRLLVQYLEKGSSVEITDPSGSVRTGTVIRPSDQFGRYEVRRDSEKLTDRDATFTVDSCSLAREDARNGNLPRTDQLEFFQPSTTLTWTGTGDTNPQDIEWSCSTDNLPDQSTFSIGMSGMSTHDSDPMFSASEASASGQDMLPRAILHPSDPSLERLIDRHSPGKQEERGKMKQLSDIESAESKASRGELKAGDRVAYHPSGVESGIPGIMMFDDTPQREEIYIKFDDGVDRTVPAKDLCNVKKLDADPTNPLTIWANRMYKLLKSLEKPGPGGEIVTARALAYACEMWQEKVRRYGAESAELDEFVAATQDDIPKPIRRVMEHKSQVLQEDDWVTVDHESLATTSSSRGNIVASFTGTNWGLAADFKDVPWDVIDVDDGSQAHIAGVRVGHCITHVDGNDIALMDESARTSCGQKLSEGGDHIVTFSTQNSDAKLPDNAISQCMKGINNGRSGFGSSGNQNQRGGNSSGGNNQGSRAPNDNGQKGGGQRRGAGSGNDGNNDGGRQSTKGSQGVRSGYTGATSVTYLDQSGDRQKVCGILEKVIITPRKPMSGRLNVYITSTMTNPDMEPDEMWEDNPTGKGGLRWHPDKMANILKVKEHGRTFPANVPIEIDIQVPFKAWGTHIVIYIHCQMGVPTMPNREGRCWAQRWGGPFGSITKEQKERGQYLTRGDIDTSRMFDGQIDVKYEMESGGDGTVSHVNNKIAKLLRDQQEKNRKEEEGNKHMQRALKQQQEMLWKQQQEYDARYKELLRREAALDSNNKIQIGGTKVPQFNSGEAVMVTKEFTAQSQNVPLATGFQGVIESVTQDGYMVKFNGQYQAFAISTTESNNFAKLPQLQTNSQPWTQSAKPVQQQQQPPQAVPGQVQSTQYPPSPLHSSAYQNQPQYPNAVQYPQQNVAYPPGTVPWGGNVAFITVPYAQMQPQQPYMQQNVYQQTPNTMVSMMSYHQPNAMQQLQTPSPTNQGAYSPMSASPVHFAMPQTQPWPHQHPHSYGTLASSTTAISPINSQETPSQQPSLKQTCSQCGRGLDENGRCPNFHT